MAAREEGVLDQTEKRMSKDRLGIGIIGSGFNARFHLKAFVGVRDADIRGIWSPNANNRAEAANLAHALEVGEPKLYRSISEMVADPAIEAIWVCGPNHTRLENFEEILEAVTHGRATLKGVACEKPLARNVAEAKRDRKSTRLNSSHTVISYAVFCLKKKKSR